jgi:hypothetical protein
MITGQHEQLLPAGEDDRNQLDREIHGCMNRIHECLEVVAGYQLKLEKHEFTDQYAQMAAGFVTNNMMQLSYLEEDFRKAVAEDKAYDEVDRLLVHAQHVATIAEDEWNSLKKKFGKLIPPDTKIEHKSSTDRSKYSIDDLEKTSS